MLLSDYDKSKYWKATDLDRERKVKIRAVTEEELNDGKGTKDRKVVIWFTTSEKGLPLNKTNLRTLKGAFGDDVAGLINRVIALFPVMADNGKPGIRIRILPPKAGNGAAVTAPSPAPVTDPELEPDPKLSTSEELDDEIPF